MCIRDRSRDELAPDGMKDIFGFAAQAGIEAMVLGRIDKKWVRDVSFMRTAIEDVYKRQVEMEAEFCGKPVFFSGGSWKDRQKIRMAVSGSYLDDE